MSRKVFMITGGSEAEREAKAAQLIGGRTALRVKWADVTQRFGLLKLLQQPSVLLIEDVTRVRHDLDLLKTLCKSDPIYVEQWGESDRLVPAPPLTIFLVEDLPQFLRESRHFEVVDLGEPAGLENAISDEMIAPWLNLGRLFRRKEEKQPRKLYIPKDHVHDVLLAWDDYDPNKAASCYNFWNFVAGLLPETAEKGTSWSFKYREDRLRPYLLEEKPYK